RDISGAISGRCGLVGCARRSSDRTKASRKRAGFHHSPPHRQRSADQFLVIAREDLPVGEGRRNPRKPSSPQNRGGFEQMHTADLTAPLGRESREDQVPFVREQKYCVT